MFPVKLHLRVVPSSGPAFDAERSVMVPHIGKGMTLYGLTQLSDAEEDYPLTVEEVSWDARLSRNKSDSVGIIAYLAIEDYQDQSGLLTDHYSSAYLSKNTYKDWHITVDA